MPVVHMADVYGTRYVPKRASWVMRLAATGLAWLGIQDRATFLQRYATTLGRTIYLPFTPGETLVPTLADQVATCVHEHVHVYQRVTDGWRYLWRYATNTEDRAHYEAEAYGRNLKLAYWYDGRILDPAVLADKLAQYGCSPADIDMARTILDATAWQVVLGKVAHPVSRTAILWWQAHGVERQPEKKIRHSVDN